MQCIAMKSFIPSNFSPLSSSVVAIIRCIKMGIVNWSSCYSICWIWVLALEASNGWKIVLRHTPGGLYPTGGWCITSREILHCSATLELITMDDNSISQLGSENVKLHEYRQSLESQSYNECKFCHLRQTGVCLKCGYCYTCHPVIESAERRSAVASA